MAKNSKAKKSKHLKRLLVVLVIVGLLGSYVIPQQFSFGSDDAKYTVRFLNTDESVISEQSVLYGGSAEDPGFGAINPIENMELQGWNTEQWRFVESDVDVRPYFLPSQVAEAIAVNEEETAPEDEPAPEEEDPDSEAPDADESDEEDIDKPDGDPDYPAATLTYNTPDGTAVTLKADSGVLPEGVTMTAVKITDSELEDALADKVAEADRELIKFVAYKITLFDKDGNEIQPNGNVTVTIENPSIKASGDQRLQMFHVPEDAPVTDMEKIADGTNTATTSSFSTYILGVTGTAGDLVETQNVPAGGPRDWNAVLNGGQLGWGIPASAQRLLFNDVSNNNQMYLDYVYMVVGDDGEVTLYFLAVSVNKKFNDAKSYMNFAGIDGVRVGFWDKGKDGGNYVQYAVFKVVIPADQTFKLIGSTLNIVNEGIEPHSIFARPMVFTNLYFTEHYVYDEGVPGEILAVTKVGAFPLDAATVTGHPISIPGFTYMAGHEKEVASAPAVNGARLKLYYVRTGVAKQILVTGVNGSVPYDGVSHTLNSTTNKILAPAAPAAPGVNYLYQITLPGIPADEAKYYSLVGAAVTDANANPSGTNAGTYPQTLKLEPGYKIYYTGPNPLDPTKVNKPEDRTYEFGVPTCINGALIITANNQAITVSPASASKVYDGTPLFDSSITVTGVPAGHFVVASAVGTRTDVGISDNVIDPASLKIYRGTFSNMAAAVDVTSSFNNVSITNNPGKLEVTPRPVTITADGATKVYDGIALTKPTYTVQARTATPQEGLLSGHQVTNITVTGSQTDVGPGTGVLNNILSRTAKIMSGGTDVTNNYEIIYVDNTLTVTPRSITITAASAQKEYDGTPLTNNGYSVTAGSIASGDKVGSISITGSQTNIGSSGNDAENAVIMRGETNVTGNYIITFAPGNLKVTKSQAVITITAAGGEKVYDGFALVKDDFTTSNIPAGVARVEAVVSGSQTPVGESANKITSYKLFNSNNEDVTENYAAATLVDGKLKVTPRPITITADSDEKVYDGKVLTNDGYKITSGDLAAGHTLESVTVSGSQLGAGSSANTPGGAVIMSGGDDVTKNYAVTYTKGTLTVEKRPVTITAGSGEKAYDGIALEKNEYEVSGSTKNEDGIFVITETGHTVDSVTVTGSQLYPGQGDNIAGDAKIMDGDTDVTNNYDVKYVKGTLLVTNSTAKVTITAASDSKQYDGSALTNGGSTNTGLPAGVTEIKTIVQGSQTEVGSSANTITSYKYFNGSRDVTDYFPEAALVTGTLEVTPNGTEIIITAASGEKVYDGTELFNHVYTYSPLTLPKGVTRIEAVVEGGQTGVGSSDNEIVKHILWNGNEDVTKYFSNVKLVNGALIVTPRPLQITAASETKAFDGLPLTNGGYEITSGTLAPGTKISSVTVTGSRTEPGSVPNVPGGAVIILTGSGEDVTKNYEISYVNGTLLVTKNETAIIVTSASASKNYDGKALTNPAYAEVLTTGVTRVEAYVIGTQTEIGESPNYFKTDSGVPGEGEIIYTLWNGSQNVTEFFTNVRFVEGTLKVAEKPIIIQAVDKEKVYDGTPLTSNEVKIVSGILEPGHYIDEENVVTNGSQLEPGTSYNAITNLVIRDRNDEDRDVTFTYNMTLRTGSLTVTDFEDLITVSTPSGNKTYDGTALTAGPASASNLPAGHYIDIKVTGSQTIVGNSPNTVDEGTLVIRNAAGGDVTGFFKAVTYNLGTLIVNPNTEDEITITAASETRKYNGDPLVNAGFTYSTLPAGIDRVEAVVMGTITDAGTVNNVITGYKLYFGGMEVTGLFRNATLVNGSLTVEPLKITLTSASDEKAYDGSPLTNNNVTRSGDGFVSGQGVTTVVTGTITDPGTKDNEFTYGFNEGTKPVNYEITTVFGELKITKSEADITITVLNNSKMYDGSVLTPADRSVTGLPEGYTLNVTGYTGSALNVSDSANGIGGITGYTIIRDSDGANATGFFAEAKVINGNLTITPRSVVMTSGSGTWTYTGETYTNKETPVITGNGFIAGEGAVFDVKGAITDPGEKLNTFIYELKEGTLAENYSIRKVEGTLKVTDNEDPIVITVHDNNKMYDGRALTPIAHTVTGLPAGYTLTLTGYTGSITNVTQSGAGLGGIAGYTITKDSDGSDATGFFGNVEVVNGALTITPREVIMTSADASKIYDGEALTNSTVTVTGDGFVYGEGAAYDVTGTITDPGKAANEFTYKLGAGTLAGNYTIVKVYGELAVTGSDAKIVINVHNNSKKYDGSPLVPVAHTVMGLPEGFTLTIDGYTGSITNVTESGSGLGSISGYAITKDSDGSVATGFFDQATVVSGSLTVTPRYITFTSADDSKPYDGSPLTNADIIETGDGFAAGEGVLINVTGTITDPGTVDNEFSYTYKTGTLSGNYRINPVFGELEVTMSEADITITVLSNTKMYDGTALTPVDRNVAGLPEGYTLNVTSYTGSAVNVSDSAAGIGGISGYAIIRDSDGKNVTDYFAEAAVVNGDLTITQRGVVMTSGGGTWTYDGEAHTNKANPVITGHGFIAGEGAAFDVTGTITDPGTAANEFTYTLGEGTLAGNYNISKVYGKLVVNGNEANIVITIHDNSKMYDGRALTPVSHTVTGLPAGFTLTIDGYTGSITNVTQSGAGLGGISGYKITKDSDGSEATGFFGNVEVVNGALTITPREVIMTSADDNKIYDGEALTNGTVTVTGDGFVYGEGAAYDVTGTITDPGKTANEFTYTLGAGTLAGNYTIVKVYGELAVTGSDAKIIVNVHNNTKKYDGSALVPVAHTVVGLPEGFTLTIEGYTGSITNVTESGAGLGSISGYAITKDSDGSVATNFFDPATINNGALTITPRYITFTSADDSKAYDGSPLTNDNIAEAGDGFAAGEGVLISFTGTITDPGTVDNEFSYTYNAGTLSGNYRINPVFGELEVTMSEAAITITVLSNTKMYDGTALTPVDRSVAGLPEGYTLNVTSYTGSALNVSDSAAGIGGISGYTIIRNSDGKNVTDYFAEAAVVKGDLTITQRSVVMTSGGGAWTYDGMPHSNTNDPVITGNGFVTGEGAAYNVTGTITDPDEKPNTFTYELKERTLAENYNIRTVEGTLTVTRNEKPVVLTVHDNNKMYNGRALTPVDHTVEGLPEGFTLTIEGYTGSITNVTQSGAGLGGIQGYTITKDSDGSVATSFFAPVTVVNGALTITPREVIMTSADDKKAYDGDPLTNHTVTVTGDGFVYGEGAEYDVTGTITDPGNTDNEFTYELGEGTLAGNYTIVKVYGELAVTGSEAKIVLTIHDNNKMYNSEELVPVAHTVEGLPEGFTLTITGYTGSITNVTQSGIGLGGIAGYTITKDSDGSVATSFFDPATVNNGALTITPRFITFTSADASKPYDGSPLTNDNIAEAGDGFVSGEGLTINVTGTITNPGAAANEFDYTYNEGTLPGNYNIKTNYGELEITISEANITVTVLNNSKTYDGSALTPADRSVAGLPDGFTLNVTNYTGSIVNVNESAGGIGGIAGYTITKDSDGSVVTAFFKDAAVVPGNLTITQRPVTITVDDKTKTYNDNDPAFTGGVTTGNLVNSGDLGAITYGREIGFVNEGVGVYEDKLTVYFTDNNNYSVTVIPGTLTITWKSITIDLTDDPDDPGTGGGDDPSVITGEGFRKIYGDDDPHPVNVVQKRIQDLIDELLVMQGRDAGEIKIIVAETDYREAGETVAGSAYNYTVGYEVVNAELNDLMGENGININANLWIKVRPLLITALDAEKVFNGGPLTQSEFSVSGLAPADKDAAVTMNMTEGSTRTLVGTTPNVPAEDTVIMNGTENVTGNYKISYNNGTLTVTPRGFTIDLTDDPDGPDDPGNDPDDPEKPPVVTPGDGSDIVTGAGFKKTYGDEDPHIINEVTKRIQDLVNIQLEMQGIAADTVTVKVVSRDPGESVQGNEPYAYQVVWQDENAAKALFGDEEITINTNLRIKKAPLVLRSASQTWIFDNTDHQNTNVDVIGLIGRFGDTYEDVKGTGRIKTPGTIYNPISEESAVYKSNNGDTNIRSNYYITEEIGELTVLAKGISIDITKGAATGSEFRKTYGNNDPGLDAVRQKLQDLVDGQLLAQGLTPGDVIVTVLGREPGETVTDNVGDKSYPYEIYTEFVGKGYTFAEGEEGEIRVKADLTIVKRPITITAASQTKAYDGSVLRNNGYSITSGTLANNPVTGIADKLENVQVAGERTNAGTSANTPGNAVIKGKGLDEKGNGINVDVTRNYAITYVRGSLVVEPVKLVITVHDQMLMKGSPVPAQFEVTAEGFLNGETWTVLRGAAEYLTSYTPYAGAGMYPVYLSGWTAENYIIEFVPGNIYVQAPPPGTTTTPETPSRPAGGGNTVVKPEPQPEPQPVKTVFNGEVIPLSTTVTSLPENELPHVGFTAWALLNLILTLITVLTAITLIITFFFKRREEKDEEVEKKAKYPEYEQEYEEDEEKKVKRHLILRLFGVVAAIIAVILFMLTQDMTLPLGFIDHWTIWHIVIVAAATILAWFSKKKLEEEDEDEEEGEEDEELEGAQA